ncbi:MAG: hypothetical protein WCF36_02110, partial [Candidatus Nanopelagicales bacterium]
MVSDIVLVLRTEHRELLVLVGRCNRAHRGMASPEAELRRRLRAHLEAGAEAVYPVLAPTSARAQQLDAALTSVRARVDGPAWAEMLARAAVAVVLAERALVIPGLAACTVEDRRRRGKSLRIRRDALVRSTAATSRRQRSQTELYEVARRAGIPNRSRMTQAQLEAAVSHWEHQRAAPFPTQRAAQPPT